MYKELNFNFEGMMRCFSKCLLALNLLISTCSYGDGCVELSRLYIGGIFQQVNSIWSNDAKQDGGFPGVAVGYDYVGRNSIYAGGEFNYMTGRWTGSAGNDPTHEYKTEFRLGYQISTCLPCFSPIPFVGIGYDVFNQDISGNPSFRSHFWYIPFGIRLDYPITAYFKTGLRGFIGPMFGGRWKVITWANAKTWLIWNVEIPLTYSHCKIFDISLVPFVKQWAYRSQGQLIGQKNLYYGVRIEAGYNF